MLNLNFQTIAQKAGKIAEIVLGVIISTVLLYWIVTMFVGKNPIEKINQKEFNKIEGKIDSVLNDQKFITERMYFLEKNQIEFQQQINKNNVVIDNKLDNLTKLNKIYYEKIKNVNNFDSSQLDRFFRNRYKDYYSK